jgi:hypothetical protein
VSPGWLAYSFGAFVTLCWGIAEVVLGIRAGSIRITRSEKDTFWLGAMFFHAAIAGAAIWPLTLPLKLYATSRAIKDGGGGTIEFGSTESLYPPEEQRKQQFLQVIDAVNEIGQKLPDWTNELVVADAFLVVALEQIRRKYDEEGFGEGEAEAAFLSSARHITKQPRPAVDSQSEPG